MTTGIYLSYVRLETILYGPNEKYIEKDIIKNLYKKTNW
tara:strand:- start:44 stop:160 length:117 start_codon:yes stop_codon:yes gene_type:complete